jgi:hypothetical protein
MVQKIDHDTPLFAFFFDLLGQAYFLQQACFRSRLFHDSMLVVGQTSLCKQACFRSGMLHVNKFV